jgi:hypothetical protein
MNPSMPGRQTTLPLRVRAATDDPRHRVGSVPHRLATDLRVMVVDIALPGMLPEPTRSTATADGLATAGREALGCIAAEERECHQFSLQVSVKVHSQSIVIANACRTCGGLPGRSRPTTGPTCPTDARCGSETTTRASRLHVAGRSSHPSFPDRTRQGHPLPFRQLIHPAVRATHARYRQPRPDRRHAHLPDR